MAVAAAVAVLSGPVAAQAEVSGGTQIPAFYDPPPTLPSANGTLMRSQLFTLGVTLQLPGVSGPLPARAARIMYKSTDSNGRPVAVTGTFLKPTNAWTGSGPRPLVSYANGTIGQGDQCAPSLGFEKPLTVNNSSLTLNYDIPFVYQLLSQGVSVVVTDYVGLGTTDRLHTYVNRLDEGHAVLDAARAARQLTQGEVTATTPVATYGYSQGGGASASAAELQPSYAPDVKLVGSYAGAPPANLTSVLKSIDGTLLAGAIGWAINGFVQASPAVAQVVNANISPAGRDVLTKLSTQCLADAAASYAFKKSSEWTANGQSVAQLLAANPSAQAVIDAQRIGTLTPKAPVRIATGTLDDLVDHAQARQLAVDWCGKGARVDYEPVVQMIPTFGTGLNHIGPALTDSGAAEQWVIDRFNGKPVSSNCALLPLLP